MNTSKGFWLPGLLLALALLLASCGASGGAGGDGGNGGMKGMDQGSMDGGKKGGGEGMKGMDHGDMGGMDYGGMSSGDMTEMSRQMVMPNGKYSDKAFIDAMISHHESAIAMANVALKESKNEKIRSISEDIVKAQKREISEMRSWRQQWYPEG